VCYTAQDTKAHETRHIDKTKQECEGSVTKPRNRLDRSDRTLKGSPNSSGIIGENSELLSGQKEVATSI